MLRLVAAPAYDVFGVGDDDQVIYGYAGADPAFLIDYDRYFPGAAHLQLEVNYRCPADVVGAAANLLAYNRRPRPEDDPRREARRRAPRSHDRASRAPEQLPGRRARAGRASGSTAAPRPSDIAVLTRVRSVLLGVQLLCAQAEHPGQRADRDRRCSNRTGTRTALAYLRLALGAAGDALAGPDLAIAARRPSRSLRREMLQRLGEPAGTGDVERVPRPRRDRRRGRLDDVPRRPRDARGASCASGADTEMLLRRDPRRRSASAARSRPSTAAGAGPRRATATISTRSSSVAGLAPDPAGFEPWLRSVLDRPRVDAAADEVTLSTVHRVKGMEWPYVVVLGVHDGLMPHHLADDVEEERRIFHVALTRGDTAVHLVAETPRAHAVPRRDRTARAAAERRDARAGSARRPAIAARASWPKSGWS